ncbi:MAG: hypothetical protein AB1656_07730 [Candidatus Omnitrophota bacterium]
MSKIFVVLPILILLLCLLFLLRWIRSAAKTKTDLLADLGLARKMTGTSNAPFYKWGWRKTSDERVWAERIIKMAFQKAGIWLSHDDLTYFETVCNHQQEGKTIKNESIINKIDSIVKRTETISAWIASYVKKGLQEIFNTPEDKAAVLLAESGKKTEQDKVLLRFGTMQLRKMLSAPGIHILGFGSRGYRMEDSKSAQVFFLGGFEGWDQWIQIFTQEVKKQLTGGGFPPASQPLVNALRGSVIQGLFDDYLDDVKESRKFREIMEQEIANRELSLTFDNITHLELVLYNWQFSNNGDFSIVDHKNLRSFISRRDLNPHFRERIIKRIRTDFHSLLQVATSFPRNVIFYGDNEKARNYATAQYLMHLEIMSRCLGPPTKTETSGPSHITLTAIEVGEAMQLDKSLSELIEKQKKFSIFEREVNENEAANRGWVLNLPVGEGMIGNLKELNQDEYQFYARFDCDKAGDIDFETNTYNAAKQRQLFLNMIMDSFYSSPPLEGPIETPGNNSSA